MADGNRSGTFVVVVIAVIGLLSTVGASALGGYWANRSVERQFASQRTAEIEDERRGVYGDFLRATTQACVAQGRLAEATAAEEASAAAEDEATRLEVVNQGALVIFLGGDHLDEVTSRFIEAVTGKDACADFANAYVDHWNDFVLAAQREL